MNTVTADTKPGPSAGKTGPKWFPIYIALAAFNLLTISCSLFLNHRLMNIQGDSTAVNQEWAARLGHFSDLAELGGAVNAPGNDVFDSQDVAGESARLDTALARFEEALAGAESNIPPAFAHLLGQDLAVVRRAMKEMTDEARSIFSFFRENQPAEAGKRMATMDRKFAMLTAGFATLGAHVREIQAENFRQQHSQSEALRRYAYAIAAAVIVMVFGVTLYGRRMARAMFQADEKLRAEMAERVRAEQAVRESEARVRAVVDTALDAVVTMNADGRIIGWNLQAETIFGWKPEEAIGRSLSETIVPAQYREAHERGLKRFMASGHGPVLNKRIEITALHRDGREFDVELAITPLKMETGMEFSAFLRDITERKQHEEKMADLNRQLMDASRKAGMAEVATGVLHNVGNVLNSVNVSVETVAEKVRRLKSATVGKIATLLQENAGDPAAFFATPQGMKLPSFLGQLAAHFSTEQAALLGELKSLKGNVEHINEIVAMQQDYAGAGGVTEVLSVTEVIEDALRLNAAALDRHGATVVREFDDSLPAMPLDRHKVLQILVNFISNAKYAMDEPDACGKQLTVRTRRNGVAFHVSVSDMGVGISPENLTRIFAHGFTTKDTGHGFGLHSSALAAKGMGGAVRVESKGLGHGATFTLELPLPSTHP